MTKEDISAGIAALRKILDASGYGAFVGDDQIWQGVVAIISAVDAERLRVSVANAPAVPK